MPSPKETFRQHLQAQRQMNGAGSSPIDRAIADLADEIREALKVGDTYEVIAAALSRHMLDEGHPPEVVDKITRRKVSEAARALDIFARPQRRKSAPKKATKPTAGPALAGGRPANRPAPKPAVTPPPAPGQPVTSPAASPAKQVSVDTTAKPALSGTSTDPAQNQDDKPDYQAGITPEVTNI